MAKKWKVLLVSIVIYQVILTLMVLKLFHYNHWLHFGGSGSNYPMSWWQTWGPAPMREVLIWLIISFGILGIVNAVAFLKKEKSGEEKEEEV